MYHASYKFMIKVEFCPKEGGKIRRNINCPDRKTKHLKGPETKCHEAINACKKRHVFSEGTLDGAAIRYSIQQDTKTVDFHILGKAMWVTVHST